MDSQSQSISNPNYIPKSWVRVLRQFFLQLFYYFLPSQLQSDAQVMIQQMSESSLKEEKLRKLNSTLRLLRLLVTDQVAKTTNKAQVFIQTRKVTGRLIAGIFLAGCFAPLSDIFYAFDFLKQFESWRVETELPGWYYENYSYFFLSIGPYMAWIFGAFGLYFIFVPATDKKRHLISVTIFYPVIKILWLLQVTSDAEFHAIPHWAYWIYGVMASVCLWFAAEYLVYLFNHKILNAVSTLGNITNNRKALPAEQAIEMYATTCTKLKELI